MMKIEVKRDMYGEWVVYGRRGGPIQAFYEWSDAIRVADHIARIRKYKLPANMGGFKGANGGEWLVNMSHPDPNCVEMVRYRHGRVTQSFRAGWRDLKPLGLLLLAWHEKHTTEKDGGE